MLKYCGLAERSVQLRILFAFLLIICSSLISVASPLLLKYLLDGLGTNNFNQSMIILGLYGICWFLLQVIFPVRDFIFYPILRKSIHQLTLTVFDHIHKLDLSFHNDKNTGVLSKALNIAQSGLKSTVQSMILFLIPTIFEMVFYFGIFYYFYGYIFTAIVTGIIIVYLFVSIISMNSLADAEKKYNDISLKTDGFIADSLINAEAVKYFNNYAHEHKEFNALLEQRENEAYKVNLKYHFISIAKSLVLGFGLILLTAIIIYWILQGKLKVGDFVLLNTYLMQLVMPLNYMGYILKDLSKNIEDMQFVINLLEQQPKIQDSLNAKVLADNKLEIKFDKVNFSYNDSREILKDISFSMEPGKKIALVGDTGSGKSTIAKLLFRLYDTNSGNIFINGNSIKDLKQDYLREVMSIVPQDTILFNNTIYYNIVYGCPEAARHEIDAVVKLACLDKFIQSLPEGYDTLVGERGVKLSGGEKQRVGLARALLKKPLLYIFDEATSAVDNITEREIQNSIEKFSSNSSVLIIAHRLSTIKNADEILVLKDGVIIERGNHNELLLKDGIYTNLAKTSEKEYV